MVHSGSDHGSISDILQNPMVLNDISVATRGTGSSRDVSEQATIQKNRHMASMWKLLQLDEENIFIYITKFQSLQHPVIGNIQ